MLNPEIKEEIVDMLYRYKVAFNLGDKIDTWPNIEVEIDVVVKTPFLIRPYYVKEEYKQILDKEMRQNHLGMFNMTVIHQGHFRLSTEQKVL